MSTPSEKGSTSATSPPTRSDDIADTASSVQGTGVPPVVIVQDVYMNAPPSPPMRVVPVVPNTVFGSRMRDTRLRSVLPWPRRVVSPSLSIAQMHAWIARIEDGHGHLQCMTDCRSDNSRTVYRR